MESVAHKNATVPHGSVRAFCRRCRRPVEMRRFVDPRTVDTRPLDEQLREYDPSAPPLRPTIYKCTRCAHEERASSVYLRAAA